MQSDMDSSGRTTCKGERQAHAHLRVVKEAGRHESAIQLPHLQRLLGMDADVVEQHPLRQKALVLG